MKGTRLYKLVIVLLLLINTSLLVFMWMSRPPHPPHPGDRPNLANELGITGEDKKKVDILEKEHHKDKKALMRKSAELHEALFDLVGSDQSPDSLYKAIDENQAEIERMTFEFFDEVGGYCNDEQLEELRRVIDHALMRIGHKPPPPPPGH